MRQPDYVVDASVFVADARPSEPAHASSHTLFEQIRKREWQITVPVIALAEIAAAIARGADDPELARKLVILVQKLPFVHIAEVDSSLGQIAAELAAKQRIRGCDAVYVALAQQKNAILITLDQQQKDRVPPSLAARTPAEELASLPPLDNQES